MAQETWKEVPDIRMLEMITRLQITETMKVQQAKLIITTEIRHSKCIDTVIDPAPTMNVDNHTLGVQIQSRELEIVITRKDSVTTAEEKIIVLVDAILDVKINKLSKK